MPTSPWSGRATFFRRTRPLGHWPNSRRAVSDSERAAIRRENGRDLFSILPAVGFFFLLFLCPMYAVLHEWSRCLVSLAGVILCGVVLFFSWYRHLSVEPEAEAEPEAEEVASEA